MDGTHQSYKTIQEAIGTFLYVLVRAYLHHAVAGHLIAECQDMLQCFTNTAILISGSSWIWKTCFQTSFWGIFSTMLFLENYSRNSGLG